jgi:hypothetical protein
MNPIKHPDLGKDLTGRVIGAAIAGHRKFGPGLDEADYEKAFSFELQALGIAHACQVPLPLLYKGSLLDCGYRMDLVLPGLLLKDSIIRRANTHTPRVSPPPFQATRSTMDELSRMVVEAVGEFGAP